MTSIFVVENSKRAFYNLEEAIVYAKGLVKDRVVKKVRQCQESPTAIYSFGDSLSASNLRRVKMKYTVTVTDANDKIKVRARMNVPCQNSNSQKNYTFSKSVNITVTPLDYYISHNCEYPFE